jgi:hypothetical protein
MAQCGPGDFGRVHEYLRGAAWGGAERALDGPPDWEFTFLPLTVSGGVGTEGGYPDGIP